MHYTIAARATTILLGPLLATLLAPIASADRPRTITVVASGSASASPTYVLLKGSIQGQGDSDRRELIALALLGDTAARNAAD